MVAIHWSVSKRLILCKTSHGSYTFHVKRESSHRYLKLGYHCLYLTGKAVKLCFCCKLVKVCSMIFYSAWKFCVWLPLASIHDLDARILSKQKPALALSYSLTNTHTHSLSLSIFLTLSCTLCERGIACVCVSEREKESWKNQESKISKLVELENQN